MVDLLDQKFVPDCDWLRVWAVSGACLTKHAFTDAWRRACVTLHALAYSQIPSVDICQYICAVVCLLLLFHLHYCMYKRVYEPICHM